MNIKPTFTQESTACPGVRFTLRVLNQITRAERDAGLIEARTKISDLVAQLQRLPDPDAEGRTILAAAAAEERELSADEQAKLSAIEAKPEIDSQRLARNMIDHRVGLIINQEIKPAYIRAALLSIEGFEMDGKLLAKPWDALIRSAPDELIDELYLAANLNSGLTSEQEKNSQSLSPSPAAEDGSKSSSTASSAANSTAT